MTNTPLPQGSFPPTAPIRTRRWPRVVVLMLAIAVGAGVWQIWTPVTRYALTGASYGARVACSCRFVGGRRLGDCQKDMEGPVAWVSLSEDAAAHSVTASYPLIAHQTATWHDGTGCQLEPWDKRVRLPN